MKIQGLVLAAAVAFQLFLGVSTQAHEALQFVRQFEEFADTAYDHTPTTVTPIVFHDYHYREPFWFAGSELLLMDANAKSGGFGLLEVNDTNTADVELALEGATGLESFTYSPRIWLGYQFGEPWAVVGRFWYLSDSKLGRPDFVPGAINEPNALVLSDDSRTRLYTIDLEAIYSLVWRETKLDFSLGARHGSMYTDAEMNAIGEFTADSIAHVEISNGSRFDGAGLTGSISGRRRIGYTPLYLFVSGRGSYLWGRSDYHSLSAVSAGALPDDLLIAFATADLENAATDLSIVELQVGVQMDFQLQRLPANAFLRAAFEIQRWDLHGPPADGAGIGGTVGTTQVNTFAGAGLGSVDLVGLTLSTGISW